VSLPCSFLGAEVRPIISNLNSLGAREQTAVDCIHNRRGADHATSKVPAVQALDGVLATLNLVEFEKDVAIRVGVQRNMDYVAIFLFGFLSNVILEFFDPAFTFLPVFCIS